MGYIVMDVGTTNTRIRYIEQDIILGVFKGKVGVRDTAITGSVNALKECIREGILDCLISCGKSMKDVDKIIASGMITSNVGLVEIPHLTAPVGEDELSKAVVARQFDDIADKPIYFIPGVKNKVEKLSLDNFDEMDIMRGEEVESLGALKLLGLDGNVIFISPGSHTKFVFINSDKKIEKCSTTLTGELLWALSRETILAKSIGSDLITSIEKPFIEKGMDAAKKYGITKSCFLVRIMDSFTGSSENQRANFLTGAICYYDLQSIEHYIREAKPNIIIGGSKILRQLYHCAFDIIGYDMNKVRALEDDIVEKSSALGALRIGDGSRC